MSQEIHVFEDTTELARHLGQILTRLTQQQGPLHIALSGGSTPQAIFDLLAGEFCESIDWKKLKIFWADERCVDPSDSESNYRMANDHLLSKVGLPQGNVFRVKGELSPEAALHDYTEQIKNEVPLRGGWPVFDLTLLGMGDDGHIASIFPHEIGLWKSPEICAIGHHPLTGQPRITLTGKSINSSRLIIFLITGKAKAEKVEQIISFDRNSAGYPAKMVDRSKTIWLLDDEAASML